ncbi:MAG: right-handed parallel beta-helix repeat-containing protein [Actinomycetota bacterium]|nr:right-handed parallel beta-helix repeat-containing protein [Actinomycetota bacterium]
MVQPKTLRPRTIAAVVLMLAAGLSGTATTSAAPASAASAISTLAGAGIGGYGGDGGQATVAQLKAPSGVAVDGAGNIYIADTENQRIRRIDASGTITTVAGKGCASHSSTTTCPFGDGGPASEAGLNWPQGVAVDRDGNLYIADTRNEGIRKVTFGTFCADPPACTTSVTNPIITVAGRGTHGLLRWPRGVAVDGSGNLYIADTSFDRILKVTPGANGVLDGNGCVPVPHDGVCDRDETIIIVAGSDPCCGGRSGSFGYGGDGGPATQARFKGPVGVAVDGSGNLYIADFFNHRIRKVGTNGIITTVAGTGCQPRLTPDCVGYNGDNIPATQAQLNGPVGVTVDGSGNLYVSERNQRIRRVGTDGIITTVAGTGQPDFGGDRGWASQAQLNHPLGVAVDSAGSLFVVDELNHRVRRVGPDLLSLTITDAPDPVAVDKEAVVTLTVRNLSSTTASGVTLTDTLSGGVFRSVTASEGNCTEKRGTVTCRLRRLTAGSSATVTIKATAPSVPGEISNTATVRADQTDPYLPTNTAAEKTTVLAPPAQAAPLVCGRVITESDLVGKPDRTVTLTQDIGPCPGDGIVVRADNFILDLGGKHVFGNPGPSSETCDGVPVGACGNQAGIRLPRRSGVTVKNGTVRDFDAGVVLVGGGFNTITGLSARDNIGPGDPGAFLGDGIVLFNSANNRIVNNVIAHNGRYDGIGVLEGGSDANLIENNTVIGNAGFLNSNLESYGQGIIVNAASMQLAEVIKYTTLRKNTVGGNASAGIANISSVEGSIENNTVEGNGFTNTGGNGIGVGAGAGAPAEAWMLVQRNEVHGNTQSGIVIRADGRRSEVLYNDASNNALARSSFGELTAFDLHDLLGRCQVITWLGNTWGTGLYSPECVTNGGSGPPSSLTSTEGTTSDPDPPLQIVRRVPPLE